ncbi:replication factor A protein 2 [Linnemannia exigua]|uniref:Replication factor A protein 2 n=1 Tax=Linnemannia exigua TaxID=604196 RepID=A0AAD4DKS7_9FUNG|nr:replication factor A protein 2 [Linnemannia exigua]
MSNYNRGGYGSSQGQGYVQDSFGNDGAPPKKNYSHILRPVTIKQILEATQTQADGDYKIDEQDIGQVTLIAVIRNINSSATQSNYTLEDGTGVIDVRKFPSEHDDAEEIDSLAQGTYVRVVGMVKSFNQKQYVQVHAIRPISDMNEITHHNLEVLYVHVSATRSKGASSSSSAYGQYNNNSMQMQGVTSTDTHMRGGFDTDAVAQDLSEFIRNHPDNKNGMGVHRQHIFANFKHRLGGEQKLIELMAKLEDDGLLYNTEDEDHFNTTH